MISNEAALVERAITLFETQLGATRADVTFPEADGSGPPVECRLKIGETRFAFEHTLIEPFEKHIHSAIDFAEFSEPLREALDRQMPVPGTYKLFFDLNPVAGLPRSKLAALRDKICEWVNTEAAVLQAEAPVRRGKEWDPFGVNGRRETQINSVRLLLTRDACWRERGSHARRAADPGVGR